MCYLCGFVAASMSMARTPCVFIWIRHVTGVVGCIIILSLGCFAHVHSCNATLPSFAWNLWVLQCLTQASMQFKIVIQRDSTQCNLALRWQYCQTVPCLLSAHFVSAPATKEMETGCAHDLSRFGEVEQSCIQIIRRRIHRHRLCLGTDEFQLK